MTTRITRPINDDDRRAAALAAVIVNDTTLLSEHDDGRPELAGRQAEVRNALRTGLCRCACHTGAALANVLSRIAHRGSGQAARS